MALKKALGLFQDQTTTPLTNDLDHLVTVGAQTVWVVVDIAWLFPTSTTIDSTVAAKFDTIINGAQSRGLSVTLQVHSNPSWIVTAGGHTYPGNVWHGPDNASERGNWVTCLHTFINRYGASKIAWVEIWNEPNLTQFWVQTPSPDNYVRLLQAAYVDIKATWPTIKVVGHNMSRNDFGWLAACYTSTDTIFGASTAAANSYYFNVLGTHPYCGTSTSGYDSSDTSHADEAGWGGGGLGPDYLDYQRFRSQIFTKEGVNKNLAFGEFGYATLGSGWFKVTEANRATYLGTALTLAYNDGYVDYLNVYYHWTTETPTDYATSFNIHGTSTETAFTNALGDLINASGPTNSISPSTSCCNSAVTNVTGGVTHDMGGAAGCNTAGSSPFTPAQTYSLWGIGTGKRLQWKVRVDTVHATEGHFWSCQGQFENSAFVGYYAGFQNNASLFGTPIRIAIFSVWDAVEAVAGTAPQAISTPFGGEGVGYSVRAPYSWVVGQTYTLRVQADTTRGSRWWRFDVTDDATGVQSYIGSIRTPSGYGDLSAYAYQWTEWFSNEGGLTSCLQVPRVTAFFGTPQYSASLGSVSSVTTGTSVIPDATVEVAFDTDPLSTSPIWTDVTDRVLLNEGELQITRGASDEFSSVQPSTLTAWFDNSDGRFTRGLSTSPYYPNVKNGKRIRVSIDYNGATYRRFDGHVNNWPTAWKVTGSNPYIPVQITAIDRSDRLNKRGELRSVIEEEYLRDIISPELLQYPDGTFESGTIGDWSAGGGFSSAVASTEQARTGAYSMKITADGTAGIWIKNDATGNNARRVKPGEKISGGVWLRPGSTPRSWHFVFRYGDASSNYVSQSNGPEITEVAGKWTYVSFLDQTVPSGVASVFAQFENSSGVFPANGEVHYADDASITVGSRPSAYYPLSEASNSVSAANIGPFTQGPLSVTTYTGDGEIEFGAGTGPGTDELSAPMFTPTSPTNGGKYLSGEFYNPPGGVTGLTIEAFMRAKSGTNTRDIVALETSVGRRAELSINSNGTLHGFTTGNNAVANYHLFSPNVVNNGATHHVALTEHIRGTTVTARLFLDAQQVATTTYTDTAIEQYKNIYIGGEPVGGQLFEGTISHVAVYSTALSGSRLTQHARAGIMPGLIERTDQRIFRIADWAGIPVTDRDLDLGDVLVGWQGTSGQQPIAAMQEAAETESPGSALFFSGDSKRTFHSQSRRANAPVFLTLDATDAAQIGTELEFPGDDFGLFNDVTVERPREGQARWINQSSIDTYGLYRTSVSGIHANDTDALATAQWIAENYGTPKNRVPNVVSDLYVLANRGTATALVATILQTEISKKVRLLNLPDQAPVATLDGFVEGTVETIGIATWSIEFLLSPGDFGSVWQLGISGFSELGLTTILGL